MSLRILASHTFLLILHVGILNSLTPFLELFEHPTAQQQPIPRMKDANHICSISGSRLRNSNKEEPLVLHKGDRRREKRNVGRNRPFHHAGGGPVARARC